MLDDARFLCKYCLLNNRRDYFTSEQQAHQLRSDSQTMHLFAYREPMNRFNKSSLQIITGILWLSSGLFTLKHPMQTYNQTVNISEIMMEFQLSLQ